jgi:hypothetical protein
VGESDQLAGGELNAAVTSALVGIHNRYLVVAFISGNHIDPDVAAELFILDGPPGHPDAA